MRSEGSIKATHMFLITSFMQCFKGFVSTALHNRWKSAQHWLPNVHLDLMPTQRKNSAPGNIYGLFWGANEYYGNPENSAFNIRINPLLRHYAKYCSYTERRGRRKPRGVLWRLPIQLWSFLAFFPAYSVVFQLWFFLFCNEKSSTHLYH